MAKLKPIAFAVGIMLLIGAALCLYFSLRNLSSIRPASAYEDMGVHIFVPEEVYPVQRENHATGRQKRNHPTTTVYIVRYRAEDGAAISTSTSLALWKAPHRVFWKRTSR